MATKKHTLHDKDIHSLFEKFSSPMVNPCISEAQKEKAQGISRILWLLLVTGTDSEINVYNALKNVFPRHEDNVAFGSLYFYKALVGFQGRGLNHVVSPDFCVLHPPGSHYVSRA